MFPFLGAGFWSRWETPRRFKQSHHEQTGIYFQEIMQIFNSKYIQRDNVQHVTDVSYYHHEEIAFLFFNHV